MSQRVNREQVAPGQTPYDPHGGLLWSPPGVQALDKRQVQPGTGESPIVGAVGNWANYEVWLDVPNSWSETELVLRLKSGDTIAELDRKRVLDIEHLSGTAGERVGILGESSEPGRVRGLIFQNLGRPGHGMLEVTAVRREIESPLVDGKFWIKFWGTEGESQGDRVGRPILDRWGARHQNVRFSAPNILESAFTNIFSSPGVAPFHPVHITDIALTSDTFATVPIELVLFNETTADSISVASFEVGSFSPILLNLSFPYTGLRGYVWRLVRGAGAATVAVAVNGYVA